jgi:hypothetical protein
MIPANIAGARNGLRVRVAISAQAGPLKEAAMKLIDRVKPASCLLVVLALLGASAVFAARLPQGEPQILSARLSGKKLIVTGLNFAVGAALILNGQRLKTKNDTGSPDTTLIVKKGAKKIGSNKLVTLEVENPGDQRSNAFQFFGGPIITPEDSGKVISLQVGDQFMLALGTGHVWTIERSDGSVIVEALTFIPIPGAQAIYEALKPGKIDLIARGKPNCKLGLAPCAEPDLLFQAQVIIE